MKWESDEHEEQARSFRGKGWWVVAAVCLMLIQYGIAAILIACELVPAGVTLTVIATVCGQIGLWYVWKD